MTTAFPRSRRGVTQGVGLFKYEEREKEFYLLMGIQRSPKKKIFFFSSLRQSQIHHTEKHRHTVPLASASAGGTRPSERLSVAAPRRTEPSQGLATLSPLTRMRSGGTRPYGGGQALCSVRRSSCVVARLPPEGERRKNWVVKSKLAVQHPLRTARNVSKKYSKGLKRRYPHSFHFCFPHCVSHELKHSLHTNFQVSLN